MTSTLVDMYSPLVGRRIVAAREMTTDELVLFGWGQHEHVIMFILDDGQVIVPSMDPEGNGPGHIFVERAS